jgi:hypothetical protein
VRPRAGAAVHPFGATVHPCGATVHPTLTARPSLPQSFFEGAMYTFVFMWTPILTPKGEVPPVCLHVLRRGTYL